MRFTLFLCIVLLVSGCTLFGGNDGTPEYDRQLRRWQTAAIDDYSFTLQINCFCGESYRGPFEVTVRDGAVTTMLFQGEPASAEAERRTLGDLFALIQDAEARDADEIRVTYDDQYGFPADLYIDYDYGTADEEFGIVVSDFMPEG